MALPSLKAINALQRLCQSRKVSEVKGLTCLAREWEDVFEVKYASWYTTPRCLPAARAVDKSWSNHFVTRRARGVS